MAMASTSRFVAGLGVVALCVGVALPLAGCRGERSDKPPRQFLPDMDDSPKWKAQSESEFFEDGRTQRVPVEGVVPFGYEPVAGGESRAEMLKYDDAFYRGLEGDSFLDTIPASVPVDETMLRVGQEVYNINCAVCHGFGGDGDGSVGERWRTVLPSFHDFKYKDPAQRTGKDGYLFNVARYGVWDTVTIADGVVSHSGNQRMPGYAENVSEAEAWAVVAWIRVMQNSRTYDVAEAPAESRERLERDRPEPTPLPSVPGMPGDGPESEQAMNEEGAQ